jgi:hypothetical protein
MRHLLIYGLTAFAAGCAAVSGTPPAEEYEEPFSSDVATLLDFEFDGELTTAVYGNWTGQIRAQLMYTVGHLNGERSVARLDKLKLTNVTSASVSGLYRVRYHAKLPVAWGSKVNLPTSYALSLPKRIDEAGQTAFLATYRTTCTDDPGASTLANVWYHYRPRTAGCVLAAAHVSNATARATVSTQNTVSKYPEYHKVWEDGALRVIAIFGKYEDYATSNFDAGIAAYNEFLRAVRARYPNATLTPASVPVDPGVASPDVTFEVPLGGGRVISIVALLVDNVRTAGAAFDKRYGELTPGADLILYSGHAGLGANVRALSQKGRFFPGKYQIFFMDGCDTFAYVDGALASTRALLNPDDPSGSRYMEIVSNAMPAYFHSLTESAMAFIDALANEAAPKSYQRIFREIDPVQVVVVTGEEDNLFNAAYDPGSHWNGFDARGVVGYKQTQRWTTEVLQPGRYMFTLIADPASSAGDADLRVRVGAAPDVTVQTHKCPSYKANSNERCAPLTLTSPAQIHVAVTGDTSAQSRFIVDGFQLLP